MRMVENFTEAELARLRSTVHSPSAATNVSLDNYVRDRRIELAKSLDSRSAVYLDQRYWIIARNISLNRITEQSSRAFLALLRKQVNAGHIFCPISDAVFVELMKQDDIVTRRATAHLIDELSLGVTLAPEKERACTELAHFLYSQRKPESLYPLRWLVWSKLCYVLGFFHPTNTGLQPGIELMFQKACFDHMWNISLTEMVDFISRGAWSPTTDFAALAQKLTETNRTHAQDIRSFSQAYLNEIAGVLSLYASTALDIVEDIYGRESAGRLPLSAEQRNRQEKDIHNVLINAFRFRKDLMAQLLPTLHVIASCHAAIRWDKRRRFNANDFLDFHHAAAALAYCDVFLTERPLQVLLSSNSLVLDKQLQCQVISALPDAITCLHAYDG